MTEVISFTPSYPLNTAVLFLIFNRLDTTKQVFQSIREAKPPRLYIAADGARKNKAGEDEKVREVRDYILANIDWECEIKTLFREENLGCKYAVSGAIDWFFEQEEKGIILEDDVLPSLSFFWYCEALLEKYRGDMRVWHISGDNFQEGVKRGGGDYYFSQFNHVWGWASWANRWKAYDVEMKNFNEFQQAKQIKNIFSRKESQRYWENVFTNVSQGRIDTWDYQWTYTVLSNSGLSVLPNKNLISNIGFGPNATHTLDLESEHAKLKRHDLSLPLVHPDFVLVDREADNHTVSKMFVAPRLLLRVVRKIKGLL